MLKHRVIPIILFDGEYCVQTTQFYRPPRRIGPIVQYVNNMAKRNVDELVIIDINATKEKRKINFAKVKNFTENQFCPVTYGGGVSSIDDIYTLIQGCGVDKVIIKTNYSLIYSAARKFGSQAITYAMDCKKYGVREGPFSIDGLPRNFTISNWAKTIEENGAGEILLTNIDNQGLMEGYNTSLIHNASRLLKIPVIANGGCGEPAHMIEAIKSGASAVASSSMFALRDTTPQDCARALAEAGLPARLSDTSRPREAISSPAQP